MIKFLLGVVIVAFGSYCGRLLSKKYRRRKGFFKQWKEFNERFLNEIAYYRRPIREFATSYPYEGDFQLLLSDFFISIEEEDYLFRNECDFAFLTEEEKRAVEDYFSMLGKGDSASQKTYFSSVKERLQAFWQEAEASAKKYGDLYVKIGFLCGLLLLILIV